ncbi:hypothetical protein M404DRAFT_851109 [Pisolithus tinctorius Marx 270]|uniref:Uncharacterized protein n=1 Tax=Pisolithus tinctorius Marx 270 TaxID=870435 RepID=A0A0C3JM36_PISTI|nr:hypothetical protein M404DRAFT_851109 [Pisolithus tinctorius Marx 270]
MKIQSHIKARLWQANHFPLLLRGSAAQRCGQRYPVVHTALRCTLVTRMNADMNTIGSTSRMTREHCES